MNKEIFIKEDPIINPPKEGGYYITNIGEIEFIKRGKNTRWKFDRWVGESDTPEWYLKDISDNFPSLKSIEMLESSIISADPEGEEVVIKDLRTQFKKISGKLKKILS